MKVPGVDKQNEGIRGVPVCTWVLLMASGNVDKPLTATIQLDLAYFVLQTVILSLYYLLKKTYGLIVFALLLKYEQYHV